MKNISPKELKQMLDSDKNVFLLDVREGWEYDTCAIEGSKNISMSQIASSVDSLDKETCTVVICHHGMRSLQAATFLEQQGFKDILNLDGGIHAWAMDVEPSMPQY